MPTTITVLAAKGGTGKTTLTVAMLGAALELGVPVRGVDTDPQGDLTRWLGPELVSLLPGGKASDIRKASAQAAVDLVLVDTAPGLGKSAHGAIEAADIVVAATGPGWGDLATLPAVELLTDISAVIGVAFDMRQARHRAAAEQLADRYASRWLGAIPRRVEAENASGECRLISPRSDVHETTVGILRALLALAVPVGA